MTTDAAQQLIDTIHATGGIARDRKGNYVPVMDEDWIDLANAYLQACEEKGITPMIRRSPDATKQVSYEFCGNRHRFTRNANGLHSIRH